MDRAIGRSLARDNGAHQTGDTSDNHRGGEGAQGEDAWGDFDQAQLSDALEFHIPTAFGPRSGKSRSPCRWSESLEIWDRQEGELLPVCNWRSIITPLHMCKPLFIPLLAGLALAITARDALAGETAAAERPDGAAPLPARITTLDGKTYEKVVLDRVDPDGLLVLFAPAKGGSGAAKLKFRNLPTELRERYGYDAARAADYEGAQARGEAVWRSEHAAWAKQRQTAQAEQAAWERQMREEAELRRAEAEQARAEAARYAQNQAASYYPWWSPGFCDSGFRERGFHGKDFEGRGFDGGGKRFQSNFPKPPLGITKSHVSPYIGPMRPFGK